MQVNTTIQSPSEPVCPVRYQCVAFLMLTAAMIGLTALQVPSSRSDFGPYFAGLPPVIVVAAAGALGLGLLAILRSAAGFQILDGRTTIRGIAVSAGFATLLGIAIAIADILIRYPENTNVPMPRALLFYPTVGFVAEVVFHLAPLAVCVLALSALPVQLDIERKVWIAIVVTAVSEPTFQILFNKDWNTMNTYWTSSKETFDTDEVVDTLSIAL